MRETRSSGSVEGVMSNRDPYSDFANYPDRLPNWWFVMLLSRFPSACVRPAIRLQNRGYGPHESRVSPLRLDLVKSMWECPRTVSCL
jgi:hypothetical protein